jgi:peptidoglycan/LPS O-acetylase OafA/YrhL
MNNKLSSRFDALDGIRGVLAIAVVVYHLGQHRNIDFINKAWISVDAFYILSGFVISFFYKDKISNGLSLVGFMSIRLRRLYPIYFIGLLIAVTYPPMLFLESSDGVNYLLIKQFLLALLLIPDIGINSVTKYNILFPLNDPAWSLFFEIFVNILFFYWVRYESTIKIQFVIAVSLLIYGLSAYYSGFHGGWSADNILTGFPRVVYHFSIGVLISRYVNSSKKFSSTTLLLIMMLLFISFVIKTSMVTAFSLFVICPLLVFVGCKIKVNHSMVSVCNWLGLISYPIYITHYPLMRLFDNMAVNDTFEYILLSTVLSVLLATLFSKLEILIRNRISKTTKLA